jgi:hypothetical protein
MTSPIFHSLTLVFKAVSSMAVTLWLLDIHFLHRQAYAAMTYTLINF